MTEVINILTAKNIKYVYCGRPSIYGNPYKIGKHGTRIEVINKYIDYFFDRLNKDKNFKDKIHALKDKILGCYCHPKPCHCHIIAEYLNNYVSLQTNSTVLSEHRKTN